MTNPKMPDGNNFFGHSNAPQGLTSVLRALTPIVSEKRAYIYSSQFSQAQAMHFSTLAVAFASMPRADGTRHLLNATVIGNKKDVTAFVLP